MTDETKPTYRYRYENCPKCKGTGDSLDECTFYAGKVCSACGHIWGWHDQEIAVPYRTRTRTQREETEDDLNQTLSSARNLVQSNKFRANTLLDLARPLVRELGLEDDDKLQKFIDKIRKGGYPETLYQIPTT